MNPPARPHPPPFTPFWVGECPVFPAHANAPDARDGPACSWSLHRRRPASSPFTDAHLLFSPRSSRPGSSGPLHGAATGSGRQDGKSVHRTRAEQENPRARGRADLPPHRQSPQPGNRPKGRLLIRTRHHFLLFQGKIWKCRSLCVSSRCGGNDKVWFSPGKTCASTPTGALSTPCFSFATLTKRGNGRRSASLRSSEENPGSPLRARNLSSRACAQKRNRQR